jgi:hypothetical protein
MMAALIAASAAPGFYVVPHVGHRGAPRILAALAGLVHCSERADGDEHNRDKDNDQGALHGDLAPPATHWSNFRALKMNPQ